MLSRIDRYIGRNVFVAVMMVLLVMISLDTVFRVLDELGWIRNDYTYTEAFIFVGLTVASQVYEYLPFACLIGALVGLGSLASSSELVVVQAAGVSVIRIVWAVLKPALLVVFLGQLLGEYVAPTADRIAYSRQAMKSVAEGKAIDVKGLWNRESNDYMHFSIVEPNGRLHGITVYEFSDDNRLIRSWYAQTAEYNGEAWRLQGIKQTDFKPNQTEVSEIDERIWSVSLTPDLLDLLVLDADRLSMQDLWDYASYLSLQNLENKSYWLAFWQKALQPLSALGLVIVAISAIFGPMRQVPMGAKIFVGVLIGIAFNLFTRLLGPASMVFGFSPLIAVLMPILLCWAIGVITLVRVR